MYNIGFRAWWTEAAHRNSKNVELEGLGIARRSLTDITLSLIVVYGGTVSLEVLERLRARILVIVYTSGLNRCFEVEVHVCCIGTWASVDN